MTTANLTQSPVLVLAAPPAPVAVLTQIPVLVLAAPPTPVAVLTQIPVLVLAAPPPVVTNYSYTYRHLVSDVGAKLGACTGIALTGLWPLGDPLHVLVQVPDPLSVEAKSELDSFMASRDYFFVSESAVEVPPPWSSDPVIPP